MQHFVNAWGICYKYCFGNKKTAPEITLTLLVCESVSKPSLSLISDPNFIKSHLLYVINNINPTLLDILDPSKVNPNNLVHNLPEVVPFNGDMLALPDWLHYAEAMCRSYQRIVYVIDAFRHAKGNDLSSWSVRVVMPRFFGNCLVVGTTCCNGIICLTDDYCSVVYLWNPSIRRCKEVCLPEMYVSRSRNCAKFGFGYDSTSNDYKVFRTSYEVKLNRVPLIMQVYSANADSWREFLGPVLGNKLDEDEEDGFQQNYYIVVHGTVYFSYGDEQQLITFDLHKEVFGLVSFPSFVQRKWSDVLDFKGSVAMVFESVSGVDLWMLDDDVSRQVSSWTKMFSIEADPELKMFRKRPCFVDLEMTTVLQLSITWRPLFHSTGFIKWRKMPTNSASLKKRSRGYVTLTSIMASEG